MPDAAEAVAVHPGIAAERVRWRAAQRCPHCKGTGWRWGDVEENADCFRCDGSGYRRLLAGYPPILLLPAVPPAELRAGDVVEAVRPRRELIVEGVRFDCDTNRLYPWIVSGRSVHWKADSTAFSTSERVRVLREATDA